MSQEHHTGWISPKGEFHPIAGFMKGEIHADFAMKNRKLFPSTVFKGIPAKPGIDDQEELTHRIVKSGWIRKSAPDSYDVGSLDHMQRVRGHFRRFHSDAPVPMAVLRVVGKHSEDPGESHVVDIQTGRRHSFEAIEGTPMLFAWVGEAVHAAQCPSCTNSWFILDLPDEFLRCPSCDMNEAEKKLTIRSRDIIPRNLDVVAIATRGGKGPMKTKKEKLRDNRKTAKLDLKRGAYEGVGSIVDALVSEEVGLDEFLGQALDILAGGRSNPPPWRPSGPSPITTGGYLGQPGVASATTSRPSMPPLRAAPSSFAGAHGSARARGSATFSFGGVSYPARHADERPVTSPISSRNRYGGRQFGTASRPMSSVGIAPSRPKPSSSSSPASGVSSRTGGRTPSASSFASIYKASQKHGIPPALFLGVGRQESGFNPNARGAAGEKGLVQLMPGAVADYNKAHGTNYTHDDAGREDLNPEIGAWYLKTRSGKTWRDKLAAYNAGEGGRNKGLGYDYADSVLGHARTYAAREKAYATAKG